jgi:hypothetical protein
LLSSWRGQEVSRQSIAYGRFQMSAARQSNVEEILSELNRRPIDFKDPNDCLLPDIAPGTTRKQAGLLSESPIEHGFK